MKFINLFAGILILSVLAFVGCGKSDKSADAENTGQFIDATKFRPAFESASPETQVIVNQVMMAVQTGDYTQALAGLEKLTGHPELTASQKKVIVDLADQVKKKMAEQPAP